MRFYKLKERPLQKPEDVVARLDWAKRRMRRSKAEWVTQPHAVIDNKHWQIFGNKDGRDYAARRSVRGAYQRKGQITDEMLFGERKGK